MTIDYRDIMERCERETAYLGRTEEQTASDTLRSTTDEAVYGRHYIGPFLRVRIRGSDEAAVYGLIAEGARLAESALAWAMRCGGSYTTATVSWSFREGLLRPPEDGEEDQHLYGQMEDLLTAYVLWQWTDDKLPARSAAFHERWEWLLENLKNTMTNLNKPVKHHENTCYNHHPRCGDRPQ